MRMNLVGQTFGRLTVTSEAEPMIYKNGNRQRRWNVVCECGNERVVHQKSLRSGATVSCGCYNNDRMSELGKKQSLNIQGEKYGRLEPIKDTGKRDDRSAVWLCKCECGNYKEASVRCLRSGNVASCGCLFQEFVDNKNKEWGENHRGEKHPNWNPNLTKEERELGRLFYGEGRLSEWREQVFKRDNYECQICYKKGSSLEAHHKDSWNWCKDRRFDVSNGVVLCGDCHKKLHGTYGYGDNTEAQYEEFMNKYLVKPVKLNKRQLKEIGVM